MYNIKVGDKVEILSVGGFNERFVKVGDIAEVKEVEVGINCLQYALFNPTWEYLQFTGSYGENYDWVVVNDATK